MAELTDGNGIIILILFFLIFGFGGTGMGRTATSDAVSTAELYSGLGSQDLKNDVRSGFQNVSVGLNNLNTQILDNKYANQLGVQQLTSQIASCCCDTKNAIITQGQLTRDAIAQFRYEETADKLLIARNEISNRNQTAEILGTIGKFYCNPPYNQCGCNAPLY